MPRAGMAVAQRRAVEQQLHIVLAAQHRHVATAPESSLARFLLHHERAVERKAVHAALQAERLAEKRRFHYGLRRVESAGCFRKSSFHGLADVGELHLRIAMKAGTVEFRTE